MGNPTDIVRDPDTESCTKFNIGNETLETISCEYSTSEDDDLYHYVVHFHVAYCGADQNLKKYSTGMIGEVREIWLSTNNISIEKGSIFTGVRYHKSVNLYDTAYLDLNYPFERVATCDCEFVKSPIPPDPPEPEPSWNTAYEKLIFDSDQLRKLRKYRDEFLSKTDRGKLLVNLLYKSSEEVLDVLLNSPVLMEQARCIVKDNMEAVQSVLRGDEGVLRNTGGIAYFLTEFAQEAPQDLKLLAIAVKKEMLHKQQKGEKFFGFWLN